MSQTVTLGITDKMHPTTYFQAIGFTIIYYEKVSRDWLSELYLQASESHHNADEIIRSFYACNFIVACNNDCFHGI